MAKQRRRTSLADLKRAFEVDRERSGPTPPEAVIALYDAISDYLLMLKSRIIAIDDEDEKQLEHDRMMWCARLAELDKWDLCDVRAVLKNKDAWI